MIFSLFGLKGIGTSHAQTGELLRVAFPADARSFDPGITTRDYTGYAVIGGIYDFLVQYDMKPNKDGTITADTTKFCPCWRNDGNTIRTCRNGPSISGRMPNFTAESRLMHRQ